MERCGNAEIAGIAENYQVADIIIPSSLLFTLHR